MDSSSSRVVTISTPSCRIHLMKLPSTCFTPVICMEWTLRYKLHPPGITTQMSVIRLKVLFRQPCPKCSTRLLTPSSTLPWAPSLLSILKLHGEGKASIRMWWLPIASWLGTSVHMKKVSRDQSGLMKYNKPMHTVSSWVLKFRSTTALVNLSQRPTSFLSSLTSAGNLALMNIVRAGSHLQQTLTTLPRQLSTTRPRLNRFSPPSTSD